MVTPGHKLHRVHVDNAAPAPGPTLRERALIDHGAPRARQLLQVQPNGKFILGVWLQIGHKEALLAPGHRRCARQLKSNRDISNTRSILVLRGPRQRMLIYVEGMKCIC